MSEGRRQEYCPGHYDFREDLRSDIRAELKAFEEKLTSVYLDTKVGEAELGHVSAAQKEHYETMKRIDRAITKLAMSTVPNAICQERYQALSLKLEETDQDLRSLVERRETAIRESLNKKTASIRKDYHTEREWDLKQKTKYVSIGGLVLAALSFLLNIISRIMPD